MSIVTKTSNNCKIDFTKFDESVDALKKIIVTAINAGVAAHVVEKSILEHIFKMGHLGLGSFLLSQGDGDVGETITLENGKTLNRLKPRARVYQSVFGCYDLMRAVYGTYEGKKIEAAPLDTRLPSVSSEVRQNLLKR